MNARQAARAAAKRIEELEHVNALQAADIKMYNEVIQHMIAGASPCEYCEEQAECQLEAKGGTGCAEWWLKYPDKEAAIDEGKGILPEGATGGDGAAADPGTDPAL